MNKKSSLFIISLLFAQNAAFAGPGSGPLGWALWLATYECGGNDTNLPSKSCKDAIQEVYENIKKYKKNYRKENKKQPVKTHHSQIERTNDEVRRAREERETQKLHGQIGSFRERSCFRHQWH